MRNNMEKWQSTKYIWVNIYQSCGNQKSLQKWMGLGSTRGWPHSLIHLSDTYVLNTYRYHALPSLPGIQQWAKKYPDFMKCMQISKDGYQTTAFDDINYPVWGAQGFLSSLAFYSCKDRQRPWSTHIWNENIHSTCCKFNSIVYHHIHWKTLNILPSSRLF